MTVLAGKPAGKTLCTGFLAAICLLVAGCGFHMRGSGGSPLTQGVFIEGVSPNDPFVAEFNNALTGVGGKVAKEPGQAQAVIHVYRITQTRRGITLGQFGRSTEFDLYFRIIYDVRTPKGQILLPRQEFEVRRDYYNDQSLPLAQGAEEGTIRSEMQREAAQSLMRRAGYALKRTPESTPNPSPPPKS